MTQTAVGATQDRGISDSYMFKTSLPTITQTY